MNKQISKKNFTALEISLKKSIQNNERKSRDLQIVHCFQLNKVECMNTEPLKIHSVEINS